MRMLTKVPEITAIFRVLKLLTTGMGRGDVRRNWAAKAKIMAGELVLPAPAVGHNT
jgi:hypothetical protein